MKCIDFLEAIGRELTKHSFVCTMYIFKSGKMKCNKFWKYGICRALTESLFVRTHKTCCRTIFGFFFKKRNICGIACGLERLRCVGYQYWERLMSVDFDHLSFFKIVTLNPTLSLFYSRSEVTFKEKGRSKAAHSNSPHLRLNYSRATPLLASLPLSPTVSGLEKKGEGNFAGNDLLVKNRRTPLPSPLYPWLRGGGPGASLRK